MNIRFLDSTDYGFNFYDVDGEIIGINEDDSSLFIDEEGLVIDENMFTLIDDINDIRDKKQAIIEFEKRRKNHN